MNAGRPEPLCTGSNGTRCAGCCTVSDWNNALKLGFDVQQLQYPAALLDQPWSECLPETVLRPGSVLGNVMQPVSDRTGLPQSCAVVAGAHWPAAYSRSSSCTVPLGPWMKSLNGLAWTQIGLRCRVFGLSVLTTSLLWYIGWQSAVAPATILSLHQHLAKCRHVLVRKLITQFVCRHDRQHRSFPGVRRI